MNSTAQIQIKKVKQNDIIYSIKEDTKQAYISGLTNGITDIIIPTSIDVEGQNYIITKILKSAFKNMKIKTVQFAQNSKIQEIEEDAFTYPQIKTVSIPSEVTHIRKGAFSNCKD